MWTGGGGWGVQKISRCLSAAVCVLFFDSDFLNLFMMFDFRFFDSDL